MKIAKHEALAFFDHPTQRRASMLDGDLPDFCEYVARGGVCLAYHAQAWPGVYQVHLGVMPMAWGNTETPVKALLAEVAEETNAARIIAWIREGNRAVLSLARRVGFEIDGRLDMADPVLMLGWRPRCL